MLKPLSMLSAALLCVLTLPAHAGSYSISFSGPAAPVNHGQMSGNVTQAAASSSSEFWAGCHEGDFFCQAAGYTGSTGALVSGLWDDSLGAALTANVQRLGITGETSFVGGVTPLDHRVDGILTIALTPEDLLLVSPTLALGKRVQFSGPWFATSAANPFTFQANWSSTLDMLDIPPGYDVIAETFVTAVMSFTDLSRERISFSFGYVGTGTDGFTVNTSDLISGSDANDFVSIRMFGETRLTVIAAPIPEPSTYALMLAGLAAVAFAAKLRTMKDAQLTA